MREIVERKKITGFPVVDPKTGKLVGMLTNRDMRFEVDKSRPVREVMTKMPLVTGKVGMSKDEAHALLAKHKIEKLPIVDDAGRLVGIITADDVAEAVERKDYADQPEGRALPLVRGMVLSVKFFGIVILGNLIAFALLWVPLVNVGAFFVVNGYLLGREYFQFASLRYRSEDQAAAMRNRNGGRIFIAGLVIAACLAIPIVNLLTPLFAAAMMVHLHQKLSRREGGVPHPGPVI